MKKFLLLVLIFTVSKTFPQIYYNPDAVLETDTLWDYFSELNYYKNQSPLEKVLIAENKINVLKVQSFKFDRRDNKKLKWYSVYSFDIKNNLISKQDYNKKGKLVGNSVFLYNESNNMVSYILFNRNGKIRQKDSLEYSIDGYLISETEYHRKGITPKNKITASYNDKGEITMINFFRYTFDNNEFLEENYVTTYSGDGTKGETKLYNSNGKLSNTWSFKCGTDKNSNKIRLKDSTEVCIKYDYASDGGKTKTLIYTNSKNRISKTCLRYNAEGNLYEWVTYKNKNIIGKKITATYNADNNVVESETYKRGGEKIRNKYVVNYNSNKLVAEYYIYSNTKKIKNKYTYDYNEKGLPVVITNYKTSERKYCSTEYGYEFFK